MFNSMRHDSNNSSAGGPRADASPLVLPRKRGRKKVDGLVEARRQQILTAALDLFGTKGFHRTTTQDLADSADVSVGLIYQYFKDKEDLLAAAIGQIFDAYLTEIPLAVEAAADPLSRFRAAVHAYCRVIDEHREAALLGYRETRSLSKTATKGLMAKETQSTALIAERVTECIDAGVFRPVDVAMLTYHIVVFVHSWALNSWRLKGQFKREDYVDVGVDMLLGPIVQQPEPAPARKAAKTPKTASRRSSHAGRRTA
uniref:Putative transcription regulator n=2 Tax=Variovorax sp. DB1 TaxID=1179817 RepID=I3RYF3_9BURK|nr:putative transcription regulator [Variovorax sp. DB1]